MLLSQPIEEKRHMAKASATKANRATERPAPGQAVVVDATKLKRTKVWGEIDKAVNWEGAFAVYGGNGTTASSTIVYEVEPGKRLGWHTDATEETQYIIAGQGKLYLEDGSVHPVGPGSVFVLPTPMRHDLENTGKETLRAVAFFADVQAGFRPGDAAAEEPHPRHAKPRRLTDQREARHQQGQITAPANPVKNSARRVGVVRTISPPPALTAG
jgi:quercetin dioxygenase-like cupin family protein